MRFSLRIVSHRVALALGATALTIALLIAVILSPLALRRFGTSTKINWSQLSNIGQTYGAVSALLTAMALAGVVASLLFQARDIRIAREQAERTFHNELIRMTMDDPLYMAAVGYPWDMPIPPDQDRIREYLFIHLWVSYWESFYLIGAMQEYTLRRVCEHELFRGRAGREYWEQAKNGRFLYAKGRHLRRFNEILDESYHRAIASYPIAATPIIVNQAPKTVPNRSRTDAARAVGAFLIAAATGALIDRIINDRK